MGTFPRRVLTAVIPAAVAASLTLWPSGEGGVAGVPSCGNTLTGPPRYEVRPADCLLRAYRQGTAAQGVITSYTIDGDPIVYRIDVFAADFVKVQVARRDRSAVLESVAYLCEGLERPAAPTPGAGLEAVGCAGPPVYLDGSELRRLVIR